MTKMHQDPLFMTIQYTMDPHDRLPVNFQDTGISRFCGHGNVHEATHGNESLGPALPIQGQMIFLAQLKRLDSILKASGLENLKSTEEERPTS